MTGAGGAYERVTSGEGGALVEICETGESCATGATGGWSTGCATCEICDMSAGVTGAVDAERTDESFFLLQNRPPSPRSRFSACWWRVS